MPKVPATLEDRKKSYYKYYAAELCPGDKEKYAAIRLGPTKAEDGLKIKDRNDLFKPGYLSGEFGYFMMEDGTALIANKTFFPNVTGEMFDWWFAWHPIDRLRYACWDSEDHYDVYLDDPQKARNMKLSMRERLWGSVHNIWEDIGLGCTNLLRISFKRPAEMGYDETEIDTEACNALVCSNVIVVGDDQTPDVPVVMTHFLRPVDGGSELRSRFWFGWQIINGQAVRCIPDNVKIPSEPVIALLDHNVKEFANLAAILPALYAEEKNNWF